MPDHLHVHVHHENEAYWAAVDEYPGVFATGDDLDELRESLEEGITLVLPPGEHIRLGPLELETVASPEVQLLPA